MLKLLLTVLQTGTQNQLPGLNQSPHRVYHLYATKFHRMLRITSETKQHQLLHEMTRMVDGTCFAYISAVLFHIKNS